MPNNPENSSGRDFQACHVLWIVIGLKAHGLLSVLSPPFPIILFRNNKLYVETTQGQKEVAPLLLLKIVFGPHCSDGAEVHCFLHKFNKGKFVCICFYAHANFPSATYSLQE